MIKLFERLGHRYLWPATGWLPRVLLGVLLAAAILDPLLVHFAEPRFVAIGGADLGLARNWGYKEWSQSLPGPYGPLTSLYRWSGAHSELVFTPVAHRQPHLLTLKLIGGRPDNSIVAPVAVRAQTQFVNAIAVAPALRHYQLLIPGSPSVSSELRVQLAVPTAQLGVDARDVGIIGVAAMMDTVGSGGWWLGLQLPLCLGSLIVLVVACGATWRVAAIGSVVGLLLLLIGVAVPALTLRGARTLAELWGIAALVIMGARTLNHWSQLAPRQIAGWSATALVVSAALWFTPTIASDGVAYYAYLRSLAVDGDLEFTNEFAGPDVPFQHPPTRYATTRTITGRAANEHAVGPAIIWAPFYAAASLVVAVGNLAGAGWPTNGYALPHIALINLASLLALPLTIWFSYRTIRPWTQHWSALLSSCSLVVGSALLYFGLFEGAFAHPLAAATVAAFVWWWTRARLSRTIRQWVVLGLLAGLMCMIYWINALLLVLPAGDLLINGCAAFSQRDWRRLRHLVVSGLLFGVALLLAFSPQMIVWQILYGAPLLVPQGVGFAGPSEFEALALLVSPLHGMLLWAPIVVLGVLGLPWHVARRGLEGWLVVLAFCLYFLYNATLFDWHGSGTFGPRRLANVWPLLAPGLALLLEALHRRARWLPLALCTLAVTWSTAVLVRFVSYQLPRQTSELAALGVAEFVLAPDNLPWGALPNLLRGALVPRLILRAIGSGAAADWVQCAVLLGGLVIVATAGVQGIRWLNAWLDQLDNGADARPAAEVSDVGTSRLVEDAAQA